MGNFDSDALLRFRGGGAEVRSENKIGRLAQRRIGRQRFFLEDIESGGRDVATAQGFDQGRLLDQATARTVDQANGVARFF